MRPLIEQTNQEPADAVARCQECGRWLTLADHIGTAGNGYTDGSLDKYRCDVCGAILVRRHEGR
jgi:ribosomal protein S27E